MSGCNRRGARYCRRLYLPPKYCPKAATEPCLAAGQPLWEGGGATEGNFRAAMMDTDFGPLWWIWKTRQGRQIRIHRRKTSSVVPTPPHNAEGGGCHRSLGPGRPTWILTGQPHWPKAAVLGARSALTTRSLSITKRSAVNRVHALEHAVPMQGSALWADMLGGAA